MKLRCLLSLCTACLVLGMAGCARQTPESSEAAPAQLSGSYRLAATSVATCEILEALEVEGEHVVGVPHSDAYTVPGPYASAASLGSPMAPDLEVLRSLHVDYVLSPGSLEGSLKPQYDTLGLHSFFLDLKSVDGMYASILQLGELLGKSRQAQALNDRYQQFKAQLAQETQDRPRPKVLILMGLPGSYVVATESSYVGSLAKLAGAENVYGDGDGSDFLNVNPEDMLSRKPDLILRTSHALPQQVAAMFEEEFRTNDIWSHFDAVQAGKVYDLDHNTCGMSATFRYPQALAALKTILYGSQGGQPS